MTGVSDEPLTNAAVEWMRRMYERAKLIETPPTSAPVTEDFLYTDRRTGGANYGSLDAAGQNGLRVPRVRPLDLAGGIRSRPLGASSGAPQQKHQASNRDSSGHPAGTIAEVAYNARVMIDALQEARSRADGVIFNPGAYTHYSIALRDAIASIDVPVVETTTDEAHFDSILGEVRCDGEVLVDSVVDGFICEPVQAFCRSVADIHRRTFSDSFEPLQNGDVFGAVGRGCRQSWLAQRDS